MANRVRIPTSMGEVSVRVTGAELPVVFWPSILVDGDMWNDVVALLTADFQTIVIDPPGHGESEPIGRRFTLDQCGDALIEIMDSLNLERAIIVGNSWGGMVALNVGARYRERCHALAIMNSSARKATVRQWLEYGAMPLIVRLLGIAPPLPSIAAFSFLGRSSRKDRPDLKAFIRKKMQRLDRESAVATVNSILLGRSDQRLLLDRIAVPTMILGGTEDRVFPKAHQDEMLSGITGSRLVMVPKAGHFAPLEAALAVSAALREFIDEVTVTDERHSVA